MPRLSEDAIIATLLAPLAGPGALGLRDDAALLRPSPGRDLVVTKDVLVAGVHFFANDPPDAIARKALRVNLSDLAAKGAVPRGFLLGLCLPVDWTNDWLGAFVAGLADDCRAFACPLLGGDTVATPGPLTVSVTVFGEVGSGCMVPRPGTKAGDRLYVSGTIGDAAIGLRLRLHQAADAGWIAALSKVEADSLRERYLLPRPRLALRDALLAHARAAMDVSDGLAGDLAKMLRLDGLTTTVEASAVPLSTAARGVIASTPSLLEIALTGGDDYEVLCAVAPDRSTAFESEARAAGVAVTRIGTALPGDGPPLFQHHGVALALGAPSFTHF